MHKIWIVSILLFKTLKSMTLIYPCFIWISQLLFIKSEEKLCHRWTGSVGFTHSILLFSFSFCLSLWLSIYFQAHSSLKLKSLWCEKCHLFPYFPHSQYTWNTYPVLNFRGMYGVQYVWIKRKRMMMCYITKKLFWLCSSCLHHYCEML